MNRYVGEFLGTFLMVLFGCGSIALGWSPIMISIAFGTSVTVAILLFQPISGAHINPAVSIAFAAKGDLETKYLPGYITAQCFGGFVAALIVMDGATSVSVPYSEAIIIEICITFLLMYSIHVLVNHDVSLPTLALGVGIMVGILAYTFGKFTGASMNPARSIGPNIVTDSGNLALYIVAPVVGAALSNFIIQSNDE